jgi:hypothetical protein
LAERLVEGAGRNRQLEKIAALVERPEFERQLGARGPPRDRLNSFLYWTGLAPPVVERCA